MDPKQLLFLGTGVSLVGGGIVTGAYMLSQDNSVRAQIIKENKKLLDDNSSQTHWEIKLNTYTTERKKDHDLIITKWDELKNWCKQSLSKTYTTKDKDYESALILCTVPSNKENIIKSGKKIRATGEWAEILNTYQSQGKDNLAIPNLPSPATADNIKAWCENAINDEYIAEEQGNYKLTLKWCSKD